MSQQPGAHSMATRPYTAVRRAYICVSYSPLVQRIHLLLHACDLPRSKSLHSARLAANNPFVPARYTIRLYYINNRFVRKDTQTHCRADLQPHTQSAHAHAFRGVQVTPPHASIHTKQSGLCTPSDGTRSCSRFCVSFHFFVGFVLR